MNRKSLQLIVFLLSFFSLCYAQQSHLTAEEKLQNDSASFLNRTTLGGYGNAFYKRDFNNEYSSVNLERFVLFVGHKFSKHISFFGELEIEDAKVSGGEPGGELAVEQCYLKFNFNQNHYLVAGLFLPRIGILNENHLPNTFNGNERYQVETYILPSTWRELGVGFYGSLNSLPLNYSIALMNGLSSANFEHGSGIRGGRFEGSNASANNLAITGALQLNQNNFQAQISGYYGGTVEHAPLQADSLQLTSGFFGTPVLIGEANVKYEWKGFATRILGSVVSISDASAINRAYANNTPALEYGAYAELGYNVFSTIKKLHSQELIVFIRFESLNMNLKIPSNGIIDETLNQQHLNFGLSYLPVKNVVVKADVRLMHTGEVNPDLVINPNPVAPAYQQQNSFLNFGIGFSF
jgi:hypothetical protein